MSRNPLEEGKPQPPPKSSPNSPVQPEAEKEVVAFSCIEKGRGGGKSASPEPTTSIMPPQRYARARRVVRSHYCRAVKSIRGGVALKEDRRRINGVLRVLCVRSGAGVEKAVQLVIRPLVCVRAQCGRAKRTGTQHTTLVFLQTRCNGTIRTTNYHRPATGNAKHEVGKMMSRKNVRSGGEHHQ